MLNLFSFNNTPSTPSLEPGVATNVTQPQLNRVSRRVEESLKKMLDQQISAVLDGADSLPADEAICHLPADSALGRWRWVTVVYEGIPLFKIYQTK